MTCTLFLLQGIVPPAKADVAEVIKARFPNHNLAVTEFDPDPFSTLPCGICVDGKYGARQSFLVTRRYCVEVPA